MKMKKKKGYLRRNHVCSTLNNNGSPGVMCDIIFYR